MLFIPASPKITPLAGCVIVTAAPPRVTVGKSINDDVTLTAKVTVGTVAVFVSV